MYRSVLPILLASVAPASALIGYGINMYHPLCATACRSSFASAQLNCSVESHGGGGGHGGHGGGHWTTTPACRASDVPFLSTLAYCISQTCDDDILVWEREKYWITKTTGDINVLASLSYGEALATARKEIGDTKPPQLEKEQILNFTASVDLESWKANKLSNEYFEYEEVRHSRFGLITLLLGFAIPIALTLVLYLPFMSSVADRIRPYLISSTVLGYHIRPLPWLMGNPPTIGQALYIFSFFSLNVILTSIDYKSNQPSTWFDTRWQEMAAYVANRTGVIAFALAPLVILFSTRNNFLLWMTNWSHSTFLLLHRWVARIFTLQVIIHSIVELAFHLDLGDYETELVTEYWIWGCVATVAASAMMVFSVLWFRRVAYEAFLILHILLAAFVIIGSWYHVEFLFFRKWGYEMWLYAACAVWFFDRLVRVLRVLKIGVKRAEITDLGGGIVRVDIDGVKWANEGRGVHTYIYFPNLSRWRFWENHPFSVVPTSMISLKSASLTNSDSNEKIDAENGDSASKASSNSSFSSSRLTLYIKKSKGITKHLSQSLPQTAAASTTSAWLEGPYSDRSTESVLRSDRLVLIAGGIGITGVLPFAIDAAAPNVKLYWSLKAEADGLFRDISPSIKSRLAESDVRLGARFNLEDVLKSEAEDGWKRIGVIVCGPGSMCDEVRRVVAKLGKEKKDGVVFDLAVEAFSW